MTIDVLISTINERVYNVKNVIREKENGIRYIICHQITNDMRYDNIFENRDDVIYINSSTKGLAKSRNICLNNATSDILLFSDDDVSYLSDTFIKIRKSFLELKEADIICFKTYISNTTRPFKKYSNNIFKFKNFKNFYPSSIEIAIRKSSIDKVPRFNELFGVGSYFPIGEETIFLEESLKKSIKIYFKPDFIVSHPEESTGMRKFKDSLLISAIGAYYAHNHPNILSFLFIFYNSINNYNKYKSNYTYFEYISFMIKGRMDYFNKLKVHNGRN